MDTKGFETEAYKLLISDISAAARTEENEVFLVTLSASDLQNGTKSRGRQKKVTLRVSMVWIQGSVTAVTRDGTEQVLVVSDGQGQAKVLGYDVVPGGDHPDIRIGTYVGILGQITSTTPMVKVKAVKVMCLKEHQTLLESIWEEEVKDLKAFLLGLIKPQS